MENDMVIREALKKKIEVLLKSNPLDSIKTNMEDSFINTIPGFRVLTRVKDLSRAVEKIDRKGYTEIGQFTDLTGMKILTRSLKDLYKVVDYINKTYLPHSADDYIKIPKITGYKGYHTNFYNNGVNVEVQIQTHAMARASRITHDRFYKQVINNRTAAVVKSFKGVFPSWITTPVINTIQRLIFNTVIPFDIVKKQGVSGLIEYNRDFKEHKNIDFTKKVNKPPASPVLSIKNKKSLSNEDRLSICKDVKELYKNEYKGIQYISDETALAIHGINQQFGRNLSIKELKELWKKIGHDMECDTKLSNAELFDKLNGVVTDINMTKIKVVNNEAKQQKDLEKVQKKSMDHEL